MAGGAIRSTAGAGYSAPVNLAESWTMATRCIAPRPTSSDKRRFSCRRSLVPRASHGLVGTGVAGVTEEASRVLGGDGVERRPERGVEPVHGPGRCLAQEVLHLGPG